MPKDKIKEALQEVQNEDSDMTLEEKFDDLGQIIIANSYQILSSIRDKGVRIDPDVEYRQVESVRQFKIIASTIMTLKRTGRIVSTPNAQFDQQLMKKIKEQPSSLGSIVTLVPRD